MTFDSFVAGEASRAAFDVALAVAERRDDVPNPLVFFGRTGAGKSHLLAAIAQRLSRDAMRLTGHALLARLFAGAWAKVQPSFDVDVLLIDDVLLGSGREAAQEFVFGAIDKALRNGTRVVMTSPVALSGIAHIEVGYPDFAARVELARRAAAKHDLHVSDKALTRIARRVIGNAPTVQSAVARTALLHSYRASTNHSVAAV